jgi:predicted transcriptional regulator
MKAKPKGKEGAPMYRTSIVLPLNLFKQLAHLAVDENRALKEIMVEAIEQYVSRKKKGGK